jgi:shikimate dehydrogenase
MGGDVSGSPSPAMQRAALAELGIDGEYLAMSVDEQGLVMAMGLVREGELDGANITIPHKRAAAELCDHLDPWARRTGAVNTVRHHGGQVMGSNTDAPGFEAAARSAGIWPAAGATVMVLGAGGAAAAVAAALVDRARARLLLASRRDEEAAALAGELGDAATTVPWVEVRARLDGLSLLVNATPAGLAQLPLDVAALPPGCAVMDLRYRPRPVDLVVAAQQAGLQAVDGTEMLLQQGMRSLAQWTGAVPPFDAARSALLGELVS